MGNFTFTSSDSPLADPRGPDCTSLRPRPWIWGASWPPAGLRLSQLDGAMAPTLYCCSSSSGSRAAFQVLLRERVLQSAALRRGDPVCAVLLQEPAKNMWRARFGAKSGRRSVSLGLPGSGCRGRATCLQDDAQAKVVNITMVALRRQDSGRYWCMRNSSGTLYPLMGFQLEVSPVPTMERNTPLTQLANILKGKIVVSTGRAPTSGSDASFTTSMRMFTPGVLTLDRLLPSTASETIRLSSVAGYSFTSPSTLGPRRAKGLQTVTAPPGNARTSSAGPVSISTKAGHLRTRSPTTRTCHTSRSLLNKLSPIRHQDSNPIVLVGVLAFLLVSVTVIVAYGLWKKRHMGSYSMCRDPVRPWRDPPGRPEPPWKPAWFKATYRVGELLPEGPQEAVRGVQMRTCLDWSQVGGSYTWTPGLSSCRRLRDLQVPLNRGLQLREKGIGTPQLQSLVFSWEERSHCDTADNSEPKTAWRAAW
ncbi:trem-like transcript 2 protein [Phyllostomus discolor]|uniref:Trem-like transcript 2 protein n=1 Tax=Phyllostomus discolor TaxID=89673 RepID=A0A7E6DM89_9CHIR|nr:trem-like transcript 2 protein [Phyllostomus discolor]